MNPSFWFKLFTQAGRGQASELHLATLSTARGAVRIPQAFDMPLLISKEPQAGFGAYDLALLGGQVFEPIPQLSVTCLVLNGRRTSRERGPWQRG